MPLPTEKVSRFTTLCASLALVGSGGATLSQSGGSLFGPFIEQDVRPDGGRQLLLQVISKTGSFNAQLLATLDYDPNAATPGNNFTNISSTFGTSGSVIVPIGGDCTFYGGYQFKVNSVSSGDFVTAFLGR